MGHLDQWADAHDEDRERRLRQLGTRTPKCRSCSETDAFALTGVHPDLVCYECQAHEAGRSAVEGHHVSGQANDPDDIVVIPGNDHRVISAAQLRWPTDTLRNPDGSPLLQASAAVRGWMEILVLVIDRTVDWVPAFLEWLDAALTAKLGARWWVDLGWGG